MDVVCYSSLQTYIYIYTTQKLRYPREALQFLAYNPGAIRTIQHLTVILAFKNCWPHDLHDLTERILTFIMIYKFEDMEWNRTLVPLIIISEVKRVGPLSLMSYII